jgi:hypothetical protein
MSKRITALTLAVAAAAATILSIAACSDAVSPPTRSAPLKAAATIYCDQNNSCYSDGNGGTGPQLSAQVRSGCIHGNLQQIPGSCHPVAYNISGGTSGSYSVRYFASICQEYGPCDTNYELGSPPTITFNSDTYEIDVTAEVAEVGGTGLTGVALTEVMGPGSVSSGSGFAVPCPKNSGSLFDPFPFYEPAYNPSSGQQLTDSNGNPLYKSFARDPCTGNIWYDSAPPHTL